jgi:Protein of unknown function (DUF4229)
MPTLYVRAQRVRAYPGEVPLVTYSVLRLALLAACFGLGYWAGLRSWLLLLVATFGALGLSYVLLGGPREAAARHLAERAERRAAGESDLPASARDDAAHEDAVVDRARADSGRPRAAPPEDRAGGGTSAG